MNKLITHIIHQKGAENMEMARFEEPIDNFVMEAWNGCDIYENEEYRVMDNGDIVLDEFETMQEWIEAHSTKKKAVIE